MQLFKETAITNFISLANSDFYKTRKSCLTMLIMQ